MNVSTSENFAPHSGNEKVVDLDRLDDLDLPLQNPEPVPDVVGGLDILHKQLDPEERSRVVRDFSEVRKPTEIMDLEVGVDPDSESEDHLIEKIDEARKEGDYDKAYELAKKIENNLVLLSAVRGVISDLVDRDQVDDSAFATAEKFALLIRDTDTYREELAYILDQKSRASDALVDFRKDSEPNTTEPVDDNKSAVSKDASNPLDDFGSDSATNRIKIKRIGEKPAGNLEVVSDEDFESFVKTGEVSGGVLVLIAERISKAEKISEREMAIYDTFKDKIELLLKNRLGLEVDSSEDDYIPSAIDIAMKKADKITSKTEEVPEVIPPIPTVENVNNSEKLEKDLEDSRRELVAQETVWRSKNQQSKSWVRRNLLGNLGLDKQTPLVPEPTELEEARIVYNLAKKNKLRETIGAGNTVSLVEEVENERKAFENLKSTYKPKVIKESQLNRDIRTGILGLNPKEEEGAVYEVEQGAIAEKFSSSVKKGVEVWSKLPKPVQIATSTALVTGTSFTFGLAAAAGPLGYAGYRVAKSALVGGVVSQPFGKVVDKIYERKNTASQKESLSEFSEGINLDNFMEKEAERMARDEKMVDEKKKQRFVKAIGKVAVGGITSAGMELTGASDILFGPKIDLPGKGTLNVPNDYGDMDKYLDKLEKTRVANAEMLTSDNQLDNLEQFKPAVKSSLKEAVETNTVSLPEAVIKGIHTLKANIMSEYGGEVPESLKPIMDKTPKQLAGLFDLSNLNNTDFDPNTFSEKISVGSDGNVYYEHQDGSKQTLFDSQSGKFFRFNGTEASVASTAPDPIIKTAGTEVLEGDPIFKTEAVSVLDVKDTTEEEIAKQLNTKVEIPQDEQIVIADEKSVSLSGNVEEQISLSGGKSIDVVRSGNDRFVSYDGVKIGTEVVSGDNKTFVLGDSFQDGEEYQEIRSAFTKVFEKNATVNTMGPNPIAESFEGGKIYISYNVPNDPNSIRVLLNGKEIATGSTTVVDAKGIPKIKMHSNLKGGWFLVDNAYERAFKHIDKLIKAGNFNFKI